MKLSKLRSLCDKAIEKYGDMTVGVYPAEDSYDIREGSDSYRELSFRILCEQELPGESLEEEKALSKEPDCTALLFYS
jgi:hypothetical protein